VERLETDLLKLLSDSNKRQMLFAELVKKYSEPLYWKIRSIVLLHEDADDVLQNTFMKAWKISTWLYRIAINESLDFIRKQKNKTAISSDDFENGIANVLIADDYFDGDEGQALLQEAIATLPDVQRMVFLMRYYDEMKYPEIHEVLGTSEGALKASYHIAVKKITEYIKLHQ